MAAMEVDDTEALPAFGLDDIHNAPNNTIGASLRRCFLEKSTAHLFVNGYELIQKHCLTFTRTGQLNDQKPDETAGSIFQFPRDPFQKVYAVGAKYFDKHGSEILRIQGKIYTIQGSQVLYDIATEKNMTAARVELQDRGDKFQYFFGKCPDDCEKIEIQFDLGKTMQKISTENETYEARIPMHVGRTRYFPNEEEPFRHAHRFMDEVKIDILYGNQDNVKVFGVVNDVDGRLPLEPLNGYNSNQYKVKMDGLPTDVVREGQYSAYIDIKVEYNNPDRDESKKSYAEQPQICELPHNYGNILSFNISPNMIKEKIKKIQCSYADDMDVDEGETPREITFFIDRSASMSGQPVRDAVNGTLMLIKDEAFIRPNDTFRIVSFGERSEYLRAQDRDSFGSDDFQAVRFQMRDFQATMGTKNLKEPIEIALNRRNKAVNRVFILITDGLFGRPRRDERTDQINFPAEEIDEIKNLILNEVDVRNPRKFRFFTVGVGRNTSQMGCDELARAGNGSFIHVPLRHRLQNEMLRLGDHILHDHYEMTNVRLVDSVTGRELPRYTGPGIRPTEEVWINQWQALGLPTENMVHLVNGRDDVRQALGKHQILPVYNNERVHYHVSSALTPQQMKDRVKVFLEIDYEHEIQIDISQAKTRGTRSTSNIEPRLVHDSLFPLQSYAYQQSAFFSMIRDSHGNFNLEEVAQLHTEFACKTGIMVYKKTSFGMFQEGIVDQQSPTGPSGPTGQTVRPMEIPEITAHDYDQHFGNRPQPGTHPVEVGGAAAQQAGVPSEEYRSNFGKPPHAGGASAMREHRKQDKYGILYQDTTLPTPTYIPEDRNFNPLFLQADRDHIWKHQQQTWEQIRNYLAFEDNVHPPMIRPWLVRKRHGTPTPPKNEKKSSLAGKYSEKFRFSSNESEANQQRNDVIVTMFVYAIFEKKCEKKREIWQRSWEQTVRTMERNFGAKEEDLKAFKQDILKFIYEKGMFLTNL